ncbi:MAG: YbaK/EbsC family protein [Anaerolineales bacterium]|nr:YbaK/EbsC family protein [Anaerolineales bacterium]
MTIKPPASHALDELGIPHQIYTHTGPIRSIEQAAAERNQDVNQVIRSIVFRISEGKFAMVLIAGKHQVSWKALRQQFDTSRLTMASPEEVLEVTGFEVGTVSPFCLKCEIPVLADKNVFHPEAVSMGSGIAGTAILMRTKHFRLALGEIEIGSFAVD